MLIHADKTNFFAGANLFAAASVFWMRLVASNDATKLQSEYYFLQGLDAAGIAGDKVRERAASISRCLAHPQNIIAAAIAEVLACGAILNTQQEPEIVACPPANNEIAITCNDEQMAIHAVDLVLDVFNRPTVNTIQALQGFVEQLKKSADQPSLSVILRACEKRGIPWSWKAGISYHQLGHGRYRQRVEATITGNLSALGVEVARRKSVTTKLLRSLALPAPHSIVVTSFDDALKATKIIDYPVVIKPTVGHKGIGVSVGIKNSDELKIAIGKAKKITKSVIVEKFIQGSDYRLLVAGRNLVAAAGRNPPQVTGDGNHTIAQLIDAENMRRKAKPGVALPIVIDSDISQTLAVQGLHLYSILPDSTKVNLRTVANWSQGGTATDVTDLVHPDNVDMAIRAALAVGIDVAGVDFITPDISRPYFEVGGAICEINYRPGLRVHMAADKDGKRDIGGPIVETMFTGNGRIDVAYLVNAGDCNVASALFRHYSNAGKHTRIVCAYAGPDNWKAEIDLALEDPDCDALIVNVPAKAVLDHGTGIDYCSLAVQFGHNQAEIDSAMQVLAKISKAHTPLFIESTEEANAAASQIADVLSLDDKPENCSPPPAPITATRNLTKVAEDLGLAVNERTRWDEKALLQIGYGAGQATYRGARTGRTSHIATRIANSKVRTNALLRAHGLPHSAQAVVENTRAALAAAQKFAYPVIVKPANSSESRGVTGNIINNQELVTAVEQALNYSEKVIVEPFLAGSDHRFLVIGGKVAHVTRHETAHVVGDGKSSVRELVENANLNPLRGPESYQPYTHLNVQGDAERMLVRQGLTPASIPENGQEVFLSSICSLSTGGTAVDVTDIAHPDNVRAAERITRLVGLDICGVDFFLSDVRNSYLQTGGAILEVNQRPSFDMHDASTSSTNHIRYLVLKEMFAGKENSTILMVNCILNSNEKFDEIARTVISRVRSILNLRLGVAVPSLGVAMTETGMTKSSVFEPAAICKSVLSDPRVEAVLFINQINSMAEVPEEAKRLDLSLETHANSVDAISDTFVSAFRELSLPRQDFRLQEVSTGTLKIASTAKAGITPTRVPILAFP
jgi:D-alanine-D-alanine ligase-like ATP-grasp enzyme